MLVLSLAVAAGGETDQNGYHFETNEGTCFYIPPKIHAHSHARAHAHTHTYTHTHMYLHPRTHARTHAHALSHLHTHLPPAHAPAPTSQFELNHV
jgi:hypothetical protein